MVLHQRFGILEDAAGYVDTQHLLTAEVTASVPMDDGSTYEVDLVWDMSGTRPHVAGNDGPLADDGPIPSHLVTSVSPGTGMPTRRGGGGVPSTGCSTV